MNAKEYQKEMNRKRKESREEADGLMLEALRDGPVSDVELAEIIQTKLENLVTNKEMVKSYWARRTTLSKQRLRKKGLIEISAFDNTIMLAGELNSDEVDGIHMRRALHRVGECKTSIDLLRKNGRIKQAKQAGKSLFSILQEKEVEVAQQPTLEKP